MIAGGGTGGHVYLGVALARELQRRNSASDFLFVGTRRGLEARIVPQESFRVEFIESAGLKRVGRLESVRNFLLIPQSLLQARRLIRRFAPDIVVGVGGYSSGPVVLAAWWLGKPTLIVEPNAYPGLANRLLAPFIDCAALALPDAGRFFGKKAEVTGIPVREEFLRLPQRVRHAGELCLLIYGGSQGSRALNSIVCAALFDLKQLGPGLHLIHQTGEKALEEVRRAYHEAGVEGEVQAFFPRIFQQFGEADLLLARAGASTVAEVTAAGKAAILVPFPGATDDHQTRNARALEQHGAAKVIPESQWQPGLLARELRYYMERAGEVERMQEAARRLAKPEATRRIADLIEQLAAGNRQPAVRRGQMAGGSRESHV
ncbi:MAG: undecaprenyldiphospho-muramoylpentapeptide beta-N-acetylglucosaminyltransferase [Acidobacteriia bacterium]|nr:undecaprenyldiphospho-muramoylpentapeptide beta-N-acetylglucosaminyltransferase [Terriglobia bacterium]